MYLLIILFGLFAEGYVNNRLIVPGDAAATAQRIMAAPGLWRISTAGDLIVPLLAVPLLWIEYVLLRPVNRSLALLGVLFNLVSLAVETVSKIYLFDVARILGDPAYLKAFDPRQIQALAFSSLKSHDVAWNLALIFFACTCLVNGFLIFKSGFLPRAIGILMQLAGLCYLTACFAALVAPAVADQLLPGILLPCLVGESSLCLWLLLRGVDVPAWEKQALGRP